MAVQETLTLAGKITSDEALWSVFKTGSTQAYAALYQRYSKVLYKHGTRITDDRDIIKDCIHDLFVDLWRRRENLSEPVSVKAYLLSAIQRKIIRQLNSLRTRQHAAVMIAPEESTCCREEQIIRDQLATEQKYVVSKALNTLTKRQKEAVYLKFYGNKSYQEIADMMTISVDSIYNLISRSIDILQNELTKTSEYIY